MDSVISVTKSNFNPIDSTRANGLSAFFLSHSLSLSLSHLGKTCMCHIGLSHIELCRRLNIYLNCLRNSKSTKFAHASTHTGTHTHTTHAVANKHSDLQLLSNGHKNQNLCESPQEPKLSSRRNNLLFVQGKLAVFQVDNGVGGRKGKLACVKGKEKENRIYIGINC